MRLRAVAVLVPTVLLIAGLAWAQFRLTGDVSIEAHLARPDSYDGRFHYCRAVYRANPRGDGGSWLTDYPLADIDLSIRLSELTKIGVSFDGAGQPRHLIVRLTDDELYQCPVIIMQEVGRLLFSAEDAAKLKTYLLKGGFLWVDDFWGCTPGRSGRARFGKCFRRRSIQSSISQPVTRCFTRCSISRRSRRFRASAIGSPAETRRSAEPTAPTSTRGRLPIRTGASWSS